jgi:cbb3-type cytochrome oxidase maturation protein
MSSLVYLVPLALLLGGAALGAFFWTLRSGQYDDLDGAAQRIFLEVDGDRAGAGGSQSAPDAADKPASPPRSSTAR